MPSIWFVMPAHGRLQLAQICMRQLRRTCDALTKTGIEATAVVVACDENLDTARELGFGTVERDNDFVSSKFNDGIQAALDPDINPRPADFVVPIGSDDWIDHRIFRPEILPTATEVVGFPNLSFVREDGLELTKTVLRYPGGCGMRIFSRQLMATLEYRPAAEDLKRGCDTSILNNLREALPALKVMHVSTDPRQIVDWKTPGVQLNDYDQVRDRHRNGVTADPFDDLAGFFPAEALGEMAAHYGRDRILVAA